MSKNVFFKITFLSLILLSGLFFGTSCNKTVEDPIIASKATAVNTPVSVLKLHCSPYRQVTGYNDLVTELTAVSNCVGQACTGSLISVNQTSSYLSDNGQITFYNNSIISIASQNALKADALNFATSNLPAGYYIGKMRYFPTLWVGPSSPASIQVEVTYYKCGLHSGN
jgi:hypothetical protein